MQNPTTFDTDADDWLEVGSGNDTDSVFSVDSASEDDRSSISADQLNPRPPSSLSLASSQSQDEDVPVDTWEGLTEEVSLPESLMDEPPTVATEGAVATAPGVVSEQAIFDQPFPGTLTASRTISYPPSVQSSTRDLRLSFPDPLTSSRDQLAFDPPDSSSQESFSFDVDHTQVTLPESMLDSAPALSTQSDESNSEVMVDAIDQDLPLEMPGDFSMKVDTVIDNYQKIYLID